MMQTPINFWNYIRMSQFCGIRPERTIKNEFRAAAARRIATAMEIDGFTEIHVIMKFKNLRSSYLQEIKKIRFKIMDSFLKPHVKARETQSNLENTVSVNEKPASPEDNAIASQQLNQEQASTCKETQCQSDSLKRKFQQTTATTFRKKKRCSTPAGYDVNSAIEKLDDISKRAANVSVSKEDCFDHFGKYIASLLRTIPKDRSSQLQSEIVCMIFKPTIPTYSRSYSQYSNFTTNSTTNSDTIQSGPPSVDNIQNWTQDSVFSAAEDIQDDFISELTSAMRD